MVAASMELIKALRERTGVGLTKCKEALEASGNEIEEAVVYLRKMGLASAGKKESRETKEGYVAFKIGDQGAALIEVNVETDFVATNAKFREFAENLANELLKSSPADVSDFLLLPFSGDTSLTLDEYKAVFMQSLGENIRVRRILKVEKEKPNVSLGVYSHSDGRSISLVVLEGSANAGQLAKDIALHIVACKPDYLDESAVPEQIIQRERDVAMTQIQGKPQAVIDKILAGKMKTFFEESCLLCQAYVKDGTKTIAQLLEDFAKDQGETVSINQFICWKVGE
ncbi:MAG: translation elongation factor Ts [Victivallaceae bacterium]